MKILRGMFSGYLISLRVDIGFPARSPDLNSCDYFLWGFLKLEVYINRPQSIELLKRVIRQEVAAIPQKWPVEWNGFNNWTNNDGSHLTDVIVKK